MRKRLMIGLAAGALVAAMLPGATTADFTSNPAADLDPSDCDVEFGGLAEEWGANEAQLHATVNKNWIIATCHRQLTSDEVEDMGGPFKRAQVYRDFECSVGDEDSGDYDEVPATSSHAVVTPSGEFTIVCKAPTPEDC